MKLFKLSGICLLVFLWGSFAFYGCAPEETSIDENLAETTTALPPESAIDEDLEEANTDFPPESTIIGEVSETKPELEGKIRIARIDDFTFNPKGISAIRDDLFNEGHFSVFDVLVELDRSGEIALEYYFDQALNTHVIESINGIKDWWYVAYYDGGWPERNVFPMDHYPYKDHMNISIIEATQSELESYHRVFSEEIARKNAHGGKTIIPEVILRGPNMGDLVFEDVHVKAHNLREDMFREGTVTAIDAILTLGDEGFIDYELLWYESLGTAQIVKNYWVERINQDRASGRCGFVYEAGSRGFYGFRGNHIHIPSDARIIHSPEYLEYYWICI